MALAAGPDGWPAAPPTGEARDRASRLLAGVPADIEAMRLADPAGAAAWRTALRDVLSPLIAGGARVTGFDRSGWYVVSTEGTQDEADRG